MHSKTAIFIIDVQNALASVPASRVPHAERLTTVLQEVLSTARRLPASNSPMDAPIIIFVQHSQPPEDGALVNGTEPWRLVFEPDPSSPNEMLVHKTTGDTFKSNPELAHQLKAQGVTHVITLGIQSECCVQETAIGAFAAGFNVTILEDAHSTYNAGDATALEIEKEVEELIQSRGGRSMPYKTALENWKATGTIC